MPPAPTRRAEILTLALLCCVTIAVCLPAIDAPFTFDETAGIAGNRAVRPESPISSAIAYRYSLDQARPLFFLSLWADARLFGTAPRGFRATNLLLHLVSSLLVYALIRRATGPAGALAGAALFLLHPLQSESVLYIWGRSGILATLLAVAALLAVPPPGRPVGPGPGDRFRWAAALVSLSLALLAKEETVVLPLIAFIWWSAAEKRPRRAALLSATLLALPVILFVLGRLAILGAAGRQVYARGFAENLAGQAAVTLRMARLLIVPYGQSVDHAAVVPGPWPGLGALLLCLSSIVAAIGVSFARRDQSARTTRLLGAATLIAAAGVVLYWLVPLPDLMSERRAYLPMIGAALALAVLIDRPVAARPLFQAAKVALPLTAKVALPAAAIALLLAPLLWERSRLWADPVLLWEEAARRAPSKTRPLVNLGVLAAERGDTSSAARFFEKAVAAGPRDAEALFNRARLRLDAGDAAGAETDLEGAVASGPRLTIAWINLGLARLRLGKIAGAEEALRRALEIDPGEPRALTDLGEILRSAGRLDEALTLYRRALESDPAYAYAAARLGVALEASGDRAGALAAYREALRRGPATPADRDALLEKVRSLEAAGALPAPPPPVR
ncbi:MAG TPA: tetratricopeptide repeat protein [Candidatus Polarisedimenticolia bacterium]